MLSVADLFMLHYCKCNKLYRSVHIGRCSLDTDLMSLFFVSLVDMSLLPGSVCSCGHYLTVDLFSREDSVARLSANVKSVF